MASNPCLGQAGGILKLTTSDLKPVDCIVNAAQKGVSTWNVPISRQLILTRYQWNQSSQDTNSLGAKEGKGYCEEAATGSTNQLQRQATTSG